MTRSEVLRRLDSWEQSPDDSRWCDALCDAAEYLDLPEGEYSCDWLREQVEASDEDE